MGKLRLTRRPRPATPVPTKYDDVMIALRKARAAQILLAADGNYLQMPVYLRDGENEREVREWIHDIAFDALDAALQEAEAAFRQNHTAVA